MNNIQKLYIVNFFFLNNLFLFLAHFKYIFLLKIVKDLKEKFKTFFKIMFIKNNNIKFTLNLFKKTYGIGSISLNCFLNYYGINTRLHKLKIKQEISNRIRLLIDELTFRKTLKTKLITNRKFVLERLKNYISFRHLYRYPIRGQRTHTNGSTRKILKSKNSFLT